MSDRPVFVSVFEEEESVIRERMLGRISDDWRKEPGDYIYDAVAAAPLEVKEGQIQRDFILKNSFAQYAEGDYLDLLLDEVGLKRIPASANKRALTVTADAGVTIPLGHSAFSVVVDGDGNPYEFTVDAVVVFAESGSQTVSLTCKTLGAESNVPNGTQFIFQPSIPGIRLIVDAGTTVPGTDKESDAAAWARYDFKVKNPDTGGNKNDYVRWAQEVTGVGKAKCVPRWNGNGTVKVVLAGSDYKPATSLVVADAQEYLDPNSEGLGNGKAPCGAAVTVIAASNVALTIAVTITWSAGADQVAAKTAFETAVTNYLKGLVFAEVPNVVYNKITALLAFTDGVSNFSGLTVNDGTADLPVGTEAIATLEAVTFN